MSKRFYTYIVLFVIICSALSLAAEFDRKVQWQLANNYSISEKANDKLSSPAFPRWAREIGSRDYQKSLPTQPETGREVIDVKVNGQDQTTITQGEDVVVTVYFSDNCFMAYFSLWIDIDGNGIWQDNIDVMVDDMIIIDNSLDDEDPTVGVYQFSDLEGLNYVGNLGFFAVAEDTGGIDDAYVYVNAMNSNYSVSGSVSPAAANIVVMAMGNDDIWISVTDENGDYQIFVANQGYYDIGAFDFLNVLNGYFPNNYYENVLINGHLTGYNFQFIPGNATIQGTVSNENGLPLAGITIWAAGDMTGVWSVTDDNGFYSISVNEGYWYLYFDDYALIPDYMIPDGTEVYVLEGQTVTQNLTLYETDSTITGTVYFDGVPYPGFPVYCQNDMVGYTHAFSGVNGNYTLSVASEANAYNGYNVWLDIWGIPGIYVEEWYNNIMSGSSNIDFHVHSVNSGIEGHIYDSVTLQPVTESWVTAFDGMNYYGTGTDDDGYYILYLPSGTYEVWAQGDMYYNQYLNNIVVGDDFITLDFYLDPIVFEGALEGHVYETGTTNPVPFAEIQVNNDIFWTWTMSDENGYYYFDMPNGVFQLNAWHPLYYGAYYDNIVISSNVVVQDIELEPVTFDGALEGYVFEEGSTTPIPYATINIYGWYSTMVLSDENGFYHADLPNGGYSAVCWKNGYFEDTLDWFEINNFTIVNNFYLVPMINADDVLTAEKIALSNHPNPFNPSTTISFNIESNQNEPLELAVYNLKGQKVKTLDCNGAYSKDAGSTYSVVWDGSDDSGKPVSSGIYFYKLKVGSFELARKCLLMK